MRKPADAKYREIITRELDESMLVEAGAGSGKTTSLVDRMLALIGAGKCTVDRIAAVTFTRKAAAELRGRFQIALEGASRSETSEDRRGRFRSALLKLDLLFSGTIHSFCARLLGERPVEARLDPDFIELEEEENAILRDRCWSEYIEGLHAEESPILNKVIELGLEPAKLIGVYQGVALYPEVEPIRHQLERPDFEEERQVLRAYLEQAWAVLPKTIPEKGWDALQSSLRLARLRLRNLDLDDDANFIKVISGLDRVGGVTLNRWDDRETAKDQKAAFDRFREEVVIPTLERWRRYCHYFVIELVLPGVEYFRKSREKNSWMNFQDLLLKAAELLRKNLEVRGYFQERFTHILVDEFQDTDPIQAEVILYLTGQDLEERAWRKIKVKPGSLFIVGDPKQSIYRFRRADIDTYNDVKRIIQESGGRVIPLTTNFRSLPSVCSWVNPIFKTKFPPEATTHQPAFEPLKPYKALKEGGVKRITIEKVPGNNQKEIAMQDAERIASFIDWALKRGFKIWDTDGGGDKAKPRDPGPGDFLILLRYKEKLAVYARALEARGIPYDISGGGAFGESVEIRHLLNLIRAVAEPEDQVALIATLRGIFYGVSDDLLYRFRKGHGVFAYLAPQEKCLDEEARRSIEAVFSELRRFNRWARSKPPATALSMIIDHLGIVPLARTKEMGESRSGNIMKTVEIALLETDRNSISFPDLVELLREYYTELETEEMSVEPGRRDVVRIMNLHKAKGLEATVVFLADPIKEVLHDPELHISRVEEKSTGWFVASQQTNEYKKEIVGLPPDWEEYGHLEEVYRQAEEERLLYVAATRAKQLLVVSTYPEKPDKGAWKALYPYLDLDKVEELECPEVERMLAVPAKIFPEEFAAGKAEIAEKYETCRQASYEVEAVTKASEPPGGEVPFGRETGMGMSWGRIIHRMLEAAVKEKDIDLELLAENLLREEERLLSEKNLAVVTVRAVMASELWKRMKKAEEVIVEVPFSIEVREGVLPKIVAGVIDLAFRESDGWVIADYKTDKVDGRIESLVAYYRPQIEMYSEFWEKMSGDRVKEVGLYFIEPGQWLTLQL